MVDCRDIEELLSAYMDGELTQQDRQRVEVHMSDCEWCRKTLGDLEQIHAGLGRLPDPKPTETQWSKMMHSTMTKTSRGLGWLLSLGGVAILVGYAVHALVTDDTTDALIKIAIAGLVGGMALMFLSALIDRLRASKEDKYKDVEI